MTDFEEISVNILPSVLQCRSNLISHRRWFHAHPELSFQEFETASKVRELLIAYCEIPSEQIFHNIGKTGVVAIIKGGHDGPCVALRADMDALPITEISDVEYKSTNEGVMHACGHDGHMASLLTAAKIINQIRDELHGSVKLLFQPAEEGFAGAKEMIKDGCLEAGSLGPRVDYVYGIHIWSWSPLGTINCQLGPVMVASDRFRIRVKGRGGHGAAPHQTVDAIVEAAAVVTALQTVVSRSNNPLETAVLSCGTINGGYASNIISDLVEITGTTRTFLTSTQEMVRSRMQCICCGVAATFGGEIDLDYQYGYPPTVNNSQECFDVVVRAGSSTVGADRAATAQKSTGAEDFSFFLEERPGCFFFVGAALPGDLRPHHKSVFDFDERALFISASMFVKIVTDVLGKHARLEFEQSG